jgi:hypothetical protein
MVFGQESKDMNEFVGRLLSGSDPRWMLDLLLLNDRGQYWAKIRRREGHAFSSGEATTPAGAVFVAASSVDLGIQTV